MYRTIDTEIWEDAFMQELAPAAKLLFVYLFSNRRTTACGVLTISLKTIAFELALDPADIRAAFASYGEKIVWWEDLNIVFVKNFFKRQQANPKFAIAARRALETFPAVVQDRVAQVYPALCISNERVSIPNAYPIDTLSVEYASQRTDNSNRDQEQITEREPVLEPPARDPQPLPTAEPPTPKQPASRALAIVPAQSEPRADFNDFAEQFWEAYPARKGIKREKVKALKALKEIAPARWDEVLTAARNYARSPDAVEDFAKDAFRWLAGSWDAWIDYEPPKNGSMTNGKHNGHQSARERQDQSALAAIQFFGASPPDGGVPDQDPPAGGPRVPGRSDGGRAGFVDVTPRYVGDRPG